MRTLVLAALLALAPAAPAARAAEPSEPVASPRWSLGAGINFGFVAIPASFSGSSVLLSTPAASATLERAIGPRSWLVFDLSGAYDRSTEDSPAFSSDPSERTLGLLLASAGLRRIVTPEGAPVDVSVLMLGSVGFGTDSEFVGSAREEAQTWLLGATAGLAVDRTLTTNLSLRISTSILGVSWSQSEIERTGAPDSGGDELRVQLQLAPALQLRLLF
jgi:hypothetical protein